MKLKSLFFIFFISLTLIFASCGKEVDCTTLDTTYEKYIYDEELKECIVYDSIQRDKCGNGVAEKGESFCSCSKDVPKTHPLYGCDGEVGEYLEKTCNEANECVVSQNSKVVSQIKSVEFKNSDIIFKGDFDILIPFILNSYDNNEIGVEIEYFKEVSSTNNIKDILVEELLIENSAGIRFATIDYGEGVTSVGSELIPRSFPLSDTTEYEERESLKAKLIVSYTKESINSKGEITKTENKKETLTASLGSIDIINPNFYEE